MPDRLAAARGGLARAYQPASRLILRGALSGLSSSRRLRGDNPPAVDRGGALENPMSNLLPLLIRVMCAVALAALLVGPAYTQSSAPITGIVVDSRGPVAGATVRVQTTSNAATTDASGRFVLSVDGTDPYTLTAWAEGYFCAGPVEAFAGDHDVELRLIAHNTTDNPDYEWLPSLNAPGAGEHQGCAACHSAVGTAFAVHAAGG
ncbi:MAG: carboxypeptidase regulatory-like domain-containing protein [Chloroflexi bacterium]|nr:carboxypeptidase regulatory-like domain-containing protein [Chloroflexota bacterium]